MDKVREIAGEASTTGVRMLQHVNQALASVDPQLVMSRVREAMEGGEELQEEIDRLMDATPQDSAIRDKAEIAGDNLREAMSQGGAALTASESFIKQHVQHMKEHLDRALASINSATMPAMR